MVEEATWYRSTQSLTEADDPSAALAWRIAGTTPPSHRDAPLPWLPDIPPVLRQDPQTGDYLDRLTCRIDDLKQRVTDDAQQTGTSDRSTWQRTLPPEVDGQLIGDLAVWRAAHDIPSTEPSPTGPIKEPDAVRHQTQLIRRLSAFHPASSAPKADADGNRLQSSLRRAERETNEMASRRMSGPTW